MAWILLCKRGKFGEKIYYNSTDIEFFLGNYYLLARPVDLWLCACSADSDQIRRTPTMKTQLFIIIGLFLVINNSSHSIAGDLMF